TDPRLIPFYAVGEESWTKTTATPESLQLTHRWRVYPKSTQLLMRPTEQLLLALLTLILATNQLAGAETDVLSALKRNGDWELPAATNAGGNNSGFFASFIMTAPGLLYRAEGRQINECEVLWTSGFSLL